MAPQLVSKLRVALTALLLAQAAVGTSWAQPGGGRRGGNFGGGSGAPGGFGDRGSMMMMPGMDRGSLTSVLRSESALQELNLTEAQLTSIQDLQRDDSSRDQMRSNFERIRAAQSDEERAAIQAEIQEAAAQRNQQLEEKVRSILDAQQFTRLQQVSWQRSGPTALLRDDAAAALGLNTDQRDRLKLLSEEYSSAREALGFRASDEDRQKLRDEWTAKFQLVLTESQRTAWTEKLGPPALDDGRGGPRPGGNGAPSAAAPAAAAPAPAPLIVMAPPEGATVVSTFGAPAGAADARTAEAADISFNFRYAPWVEVLKLFADRAGFTLDLNVVPPGTFNYYDDGKYTITQALDILNGYLLPKGYILVRRDRFLVCVAYDSQAGIPPNLVPHVSREELYERGQNELMAVLFPLEGVSIDDISKEVANLLGPQGKAVGLKTTSSLLVTDIGSNIRRIDELLKKVSLAPEVTVFKSYPVQFVAADEAERMIRGLLGMQVGVADISAGSGGDSRSSYDRSRSESSYSRGAPPPAPPPTAAPSVTRITCNLRTNTLLVTASAANHKLVEEALKVIDVNEEASGFYAHSRRPYLQVYEVKSSDPREVTKTLAVLVPGVVVNEDGRNGKIHIVATEAQHREVGTLIRQLDGLGASEQVAVIPLVKMDPLVAAGTLRSLFVKDGTAAPTIEPDLYSRQVMVRGTSAQLAQIQQVLLQLGEDGTGQRRVGEGGVLRTFPLSGRDPTEVLELLQRAWQTTAPNPVRVVRPLDRGPVQGIRAPAGPPTPAEVDIEAGEPSARVEPRIRHSNGRGVPVRPVVQIESRPAEEADPTPAETPPSRLSDAEYNLLLDLFGDTAPQPPAANSPPAADPAAPAVVPPVQTPVPAQAPAQTPAQGPTSPAPPAGNSTAPVTITIMGDDVMITSSDPAALDQMEELLQSLMQAVPPRTSWTIFTLEYADCTTTAAMLKELFPEATVASADSLSGGSTSMFGSLTSGINSMTSGLAGMTGLSTTTAAVRIIPYPPDNSLFVSGPTSKVQEMEEMLRILDSGELSASLRERKPRSIPVVYADIDDVYAIVKDVYKDALENEQDRGARNAANMFAAMMGGGRSSRGGESGAAQSAKLTLGIDRQTSQLIVACSETMYREIKALVDSVDTSAREARRTVKVVSLQNTSTAQLQGTISSLMPRVKVSSSSSRTPSSSSSSGSSSSSSSSGGDSGRSDADQFRRMMEERMRAMQGGGDRGGGDSGRPSFGGGSPSSSSGGRPSFGGGSPFSGGRPPFGGSDRGSSFRGR